MTATDHRAPADCIIVFSSASRPLYKQNILDTLAAPPGTHRQFRYRTKLLGPGCDPQEWTNLNNSMAPAISFFSMQDEAGFQKAAFIPVRKGKVVKTEATADFRFITLAVDGYISFGPADDGKPHRSKVRDLAECLNNHDPSICPYDAFASRTTTLLPGLVDASPASDGNDVELFVRTADYLNATDTFRDASFIRMLSLTDATVGTELTSNLNSGVFTLDGGKEYALMLFHYRPGAMNDAVSFSIGVDTAYITVIGGPTFVAASAYDQIPVRFYVSDPASKGVTSTVLTIRPTDPKTLAPVLTLTINIKPAKNIRGLAATASFMLTTSLLAWFTTTGAAWGSKVAAIVVAPVALVLIYYRLNQRTALPT